MATTHIPPPFETPPRLVPIEQIIQDYPGRSILQLRALATALAKKGVFGRKAMEKCSLSGRNATDSLDRKKLDYIKAIIRSRVPGSSETEFECMWSQCRGSISKSCQALCIKARKKLSLD